MTPHERATQVADRFYHRFCSIHERITYAVTTALQAQANEDEVRHRAKRQALRTLAAQQAQRADDERTMRLAAEKRETELASSLLNAFNERDEARSKILSMQVEFERAERADRHAEVATHNAGAWKFKRDKMGKELFSAESERHAALAQAAELRRALEFVHQQLALDPVSGRLYCGDSRQVVELERTISAALALTPGEALERKSVTFEGWWQDDGRFYDPDTADVPWFDKRKGLAEYAYVAGLRKAKYSTGMDGRAPEMPVVPEVVGECASGRAEKPGVSSLRQVDGGEGCATDNVDALERVRREARIEALEALPCIEWAGGCERGRAVEHWCPRCRALAEVRKGGKE